MSRIFIVSVLVVLLAILGGMSWVIERSTRKDPPKPPTAAEQEARKQAMDARAKQDADARKKMLETLKAGPAKQPPVRMPPKAPFAEPPTSGGKAKVPAGSLDISGEWYKARKPGEVGIEEMIKEEAKNPATPMTPKLQKIQTP